MNWCKIADQASRELREKNSLYALYMFVHVVKDDVNKSILWNFNIINFNIHGPNSTVQEIK